MKRCPECRRDYYDDSLLYCLDDGASLLEGPSSMDEPATALLGSTAGPSEAATRAMAGVGLGGQRSDSYLALDKTGGTAERWVRPLPLVFAACFLLGSAFLVYRYMNSPTLGRVNSIAVMPFANETGSTDLDYLSDGMTDTLIGSLSQVPNLSVKAHTSVFRYKGKDVSAAKVASELGVQALVNGRVTYHADRLTVTVDLIDPATENVIWSQRYDRDKSSVVTMQSEIAGDVSSRLRARLSGEDRARVTKSYTADPAAYELYLKGRYLWNKRGVDGLLQAATFFNQAIAKDPNYALAYAALAETYTLYPDWSVDRPENSYPRSRAAALRALELDDTLAEAHTALGRYYYYWEWDRVQAEKEYRQAIALQPNYATAYQWLSFDVLALSGRFDEAVTECGRGRELDPLSPIIAGNCGDIYFYARRYDEAIETYRAAIQLDPNFGYNFAAQGYALAAAGRYSEAIASLHRALGLLNDPLYKGYLAYTLARSGDKQQALSVIAEMKKDAVGGYVPAYAFAVAYAGVGDADEAIKWLNKDVDDHGTGAVSVRVDPHLDGLRGDPRFNDILKRIGLTAQ